MAVEVTRDIKTPFDAMGWRGGYRAVVERDECEYTSCYCEENIYKLCEVLRARGESLAEWSVVFISNPRKSVAMWHQRAARDAHNPVVWDYHVILLHVRPNGAWVYDFDTCLPFPCPLEAYFMLSFREDLKIDKRFRGVFRVVGAEQYLRTFASDRSHMRGADGEFQKPPPPYAPIRSPDAADAMNLPRFFDMTDHDFVGDVISMPVILGRFARA